MTLLTDFRHDTISKLLDRNYPVDKFDWDTKIQLASIVFDSKELNQKVIARLVASLEAKPGRYERELIRFAEDLTAIRGKKTSATSLRTYRWIWNKISHLPVPEDFSWTTWRRLAETKNPEKWLNDALKNGWSGSELNRHILQEKMKTKKVKTMNCPFCQKEIAINS